VPPERIDWLRRTIFWRRKARHWLRFSVSDLPDPDLVQKMALCLAGPSAVVPTNFAGLIEGQTMTATIDDALMVRAAQEIGKRSTEMFARAAQRLMRQENKRGTAASTALVGAADGMGVTLAAMLIKHKAATSNELPSVEELDAMIEILREAAHDTLDFSKEQHQ
jgi:hypothetical protein